MTAQPCAGVSQPLVSPGFDLSGLSDRAGQGGVRHIPPIGTRAGSDMHAQIQQYPARMRHQERDISGERTDTAAFSFRQRPSGCSQPDLIEGNDRRDRRDRSNQTGSRGSNSRRYSAMA